MTKYQVGQRVKVRGVKDAVITAIVAEQGRQRWRRPTLYQIEYTVDDALEESNPSGRRYSQPRFENEIQLEEGVSNEQG